MKPNVVRLTSTSCPHCKYCYEEEEKLYVDFSRPKDKMHVGLQPGLTSIIYPTDYIEKRVVLGKKPFHDKGTDMLACPSCGTFLLKSVVRNITEGLL